MESDVQGSYRLSSSSEHPSNKRKYLFDHNVGTCFELNGEIAGWVQVELPNAQIVNVVEIISRNDSWSSAAPRNYELLASNNGSTWTSLLAIQNSETFGRSETRKHILENETAYKFYRLNVSNPDSTVLAFSGWNLIHQQTITEY